MGERIIIDPKKQFSKRLARWTAVFWFVYMTWLSVILILAPQAGVYTVYMGIMATVVMMLNVYTYCKNSIFEKAVFGLIDKTRLEISVGRRSSSSADDGGEEGGNG